MYTDIKSVQIVIALLKKYNIRHLVLSAGTRHTPFVRSVENDDFFTCYSVVDERSAGFFAIGLIKELRVPVAISCTSGTAVSNYISPISEAFYSNLPLIAITADRNPMYLYQKEEQMVPQIKIFDGICKKNVTLPFVKEEKDFWYCNRLVNEALGDIERFGDGPVHINYPVETNLFDFNTEQLPEVTKIDVIALNDEKEWKERAEKLSKAKRIMVLYGQAFPLRTDEEKIIEDFARKFECVFLVDHLSNLKCYGSVEAYNPVRFFRKNIVGELMPEIVISLNGNSVEFTEWLKAYSTKYSYWNIDKSGNIADPFKCLDTVFHCNEIEFFEKMCQYKQSEAQHEYYEKWKVLENSIKIPDYEYSDIYAVEKFMELIPENSLLNLANSSVVRFAQIFPLKKSVKVHCNRGVNGIDGSMSSFIGQSCVHDGVSFLLIGDLSFFYDMNCLWSRYIGNNQRIMLNNNGCGEIFYTNAKQDILTVGKHIAADNEATARGWAESVGFMYLSSHTKEEFDENLKVFLSETSNKPIIFEVFTDKMKNIEQLKRLIKENENLTTKEKLKNTVKSIIRR